jgi:hypothetical protein
MDKLFINQLIDSHLDVVTKTRSYENCANPKAVLQIRNGLIVGEYPSLSKAAKETGICISSISKCIRKYTFYKNTGDCSWKLK